MNQIATARNLFLSIWFLSFFASFASARIEAIIGKPPAQNDNLFKSIPWSPSTEIIISRDQYVISYNKDRRSPNWVAWKLEANQLGSSGRSNDFLQDPDLESFLNSSHSGRHAVDPEEYKNSCYDRGHQVPSADRTDKKDNNQVTFFMSNMIPQTPYLNRVIWEHLESYTRDLVKQNNKKVYVIAGPIYDGDFGSIGPHKDIPIPSKNFKVIVVLNANQTLVELNPKTQVIATIMPNLTQDGHRLSADATTGKCGERPPDTAGEVVDWNDWKQYVSTLAEVERESGLQLFTQIPTN